MEHDLLIRQHDQLVQLAQKLASASEALATSMDGDEAEIPAPTAYEILTDLMSTLVTLTRSTHGLRARLVSSLYNKGIILTDIDMATGEACGTTKSVLAADAAILGSATSLELAERCLSGARNAISGQVYERVSGSAHTSLLQHDELVKKAQGLA